MKNTVNISVAIIILLLILGLGIGLVAYFTNGFDFSSLADEAKPSDEPSQNIVLTIDGEEISLDAELPVRTNLRIDVSTNADEFTVEVLPGTATFDFKHNGVLVKFPYIEGNFNEVFGVEVGEGYFTLNTSLKSMQQILEAYYTGEEITGITTLSEEAAYFVIRVSSDEDSISIPISGFYGVFTIELDKTEIIF